LELTPARVRLVVDYAIAAGVEARALREIFDRDRSGAHDAAEKAQLTAYLVEQATHFASVAVDGRALALARAAAEPDFGPGADGRLGVLVTLEAAAALGGGGAHRVRLADRHKDRRVTVPVTIAPSGGVTLAGAIDPQPYVFVDHPLDVEVRAP
jgi:hypothetical protein